MKIVLKCDLVAKNNEKITYKETLNIDKDKVEEVMPLLKNSIAGIVDISTIAYITKNSKDFRNLAIFCETVRLCEVQSVTIVTVETLKIKG